jgi:hypothetical protein
VELHNFNPNSIAQAAIFAAVCEGYLGIAPHWDLWLHFFRADLFTKSLEKGVRQAVRAGGCSLQLRQRRAHQYIPAKLTSSNKGWHDGWFYLRNDDGGLPAYTGKVVTERPDLWGWGVVKADQPRLDALLGAMDRLRRHGVTAAGVVATFHRRRVLPLMARRLRLDEMTPEAPIDGSRMSSEILTTDEVFRRVKDTVEGVTDLGFLSQPPMRPTQGYVSLVSVRFVSLFYPLFLGSLIASSVFS